MTFLIVESARGRSTVARGIMMFALVGIVGGVLISQLGRVSTLVVVDPTLKGAERPKERPKESAPARARHQIVTPIVNGQCLVEGSANGSPFTFLLDSGGGQALLHGRLSCPRARA
jgi:hypothetical protein